MNDTWTEGTVNYNNKPTIGNIVGYVGPSGAVNLYLGNLLLSAWDNGIISFQIQDYIKSDVNMRIVSKEGSATGAARLRIEHTVSTATTGPATTGPATTGPATTGPVTSTTGTPSNTFNFVPIADSYARGGQFTEVTYGDSTILSVKGVAGLSTDWSRESFLKFNLNSLGNQAIQSAVLVLTASDATPLNFDVVSVPEDGWAEIALNWGNKPFGSTVIGHVGANGQASLNVAGLASIRGTDGIVSLRLVDNANADVLMNFYSKEGPSTMAPILRIVV